MSPSEEAGAADAVGAAEAESATAADAEGEADAEADAAGSGAGVARFQQPEVVKTREARNTDERRATVGVSIAALVVRRKCRASQALVIPGRADTALRAWIAERDSRGACR